MFVKKIIKFIGRNKYTIYDTWEKILRLSSSCHHEPVKKQKGTISKTKARA